MGALGLTTGLAAQAAPLEVGVVAPEFSLSGATAEGVLPNPVGVGDFGGKTVVLAFFYKARTKG
jgi:peroxiredoxin